MLSRYNIIDIENILNTENPPPPFPPAHDRDAWDKVRQELGKNLVDEYITNAEQAAATDIPNLPATLYLEFITIGERLGYENPVSQRRTMLSTLTLAECLEYQGRFLEPLLNLVWAICEESSWAYPAHQYYLTDVEKPYLDLFATMTGRQLAEFDLLLGAEMSDLVRKRIRYEVNHRLFRPYMTPHQQWWWMYNTQEKQTSNWNAVCNGNIVSAAILLENDNTRLAEIIARAARSLDDYLDTFDSDGGSTEGPGYWSYGYGNYVLMAHLVEQRTNGRLNFLGSEQIRKISLFPARTILSHNLFVSFSDCDLHVSLRAPLLAFLARRLDLPELMALAQQQPRETTIRTTHEILPWGLRDLFWTLEREIEAFVPSKHDWYEDMMWMIARYDPNNPDALVLATKGGHNDEMHNQNDVGNIVVHVNGESVIADIGRGRYTRAYFSESRYEHFVCQSLGHSTPVPNGQQQGTGIEYSAELLEHRSEDTLDLMTTELKATYPPEADLESLKRTVILHRDKPQGWVELIDDVEFSTQAGHFESVLTTLGDVIIEPDHVVIKGERGTLRVEYDTNTITVRVQTIKDVDLSEGLVDVNRLIFEFANKSQIGQICLGIYPINAHKS